MNQKFYNEVKAILITARNRVYQTVNFAMVEAYWNIGKTIIEEQGGNEKAEYGTGLLKEMFAEIGAGALIMPGITIGDHVVVGAGSVVTKDLPSNVIAVGNPCRVLREIGDHEREYYFKDRRIDYARLEDEKREAESFWENNQ